MLIRHGLIYLLGRITPAATAMITLGLFTRVLTPEQYGSYALAITLMGLLNTICFQWLAISIARFYPEFVDQARTFFSTALVSFVLLSAIVCCIGVAIIYCWDFGIEARLLLVALVLSMAQGWFELNIRISNIKLSPGLYSVMTTAKAIIALSLGYFLIKTGAGVMGALLALFLALVFPTILGWKYWSGVRIGLCETAHVRRWARYGIPFGATAALVFVIDASDRIFLKYYLGMAAVGIYAPAYDLASQTLGVLMAIVHLAAFPLAIAAFTSGGEKAAQKQVQLNGLFFFAISLPATVGLAMLGPDIAALLMGPSFAASAAKVIPVIAIATFVANIRTYYIDYPFLLHKTPRFQLLSVIFAAAVNVALNILLIPTWGVMGAAYSTLIAFSAAAVSSLWFARSEIGLLALHKDCYKVLLGTLAFIPCLLVGSDWTSWAAVLGRVAASAFIYSFVLFSFNFCECREKALSWAKRRTMAENNFN